jgi:hypothetical protein
MQKTPAADHRRWALETLPALSAQKLRQFNREKQRPIKFRA